MSVSTGLSASTTLPQIQSEVRNQVHRELSRPARQEHEGYQQQVRFTLSLLRVEYYGSVCHSCGTREHTYAADQNVAICGS